MEGVKDVAEKGNDILANLDKKKRNFVEATDKNNEILAMVQEKIKEGDRESAKFLLDQEVYFQSMERVSIFNEIKNRGEEVAKRDFYNALLDALVNRIERGESIDCSTIENREIIAQEVINVLKDKYKQEDTKNIEETIFSKDFPNEKKVQLRDFLESNGYIAPVDESVNNEEVLSSEELLEALESLVEKMENVKDPQKVQEIYQNFIDGVSQSTDESPEKIEGKISKILNESRYIKFKKFEQYLKVNGGVGQLITEDGKINSEVFESSWEDFENTYIQNEPEVSKILFKKELEEKKDQQGSYNGMEAVLIGDELEDLIQEDPVLKKLQEQEGFQNIFQSNDLRLSVRQSSDGVPVYKLSFSQEVGVSQSLSFELDESSPVVIGFNNHHKKLSNVSLEGIMNGGDVHALRSINDFYARSFVDTTALSGLFPKFGGEDSEEQNDPLQFLFDVFNVSGDQLFQVTEAIKQDLSSILSIVFGIDENAPLGELDRLKLFQLSNDGRKISFIDKKTGELTLSGNAFFKEMRGFLKRYPAIQTQRELFLDENFATIIQKY